MEAYTLSADNVFRILLPQVRVFSYAAFPRSPKIYVLHPQEYFERDDIVCLPLAQPNQSYWTTPNQIESSAK